MFPITTAGALICPWAKTPRNSDEHRPAPKVRWSRFVKSVVSITITNAGPPNDPKPQFRPRRNWSNLRPFGPRRRRGKETADGAEGTYGRANYCGAAAGGSRCKGG